MKHLIAILLVLVLCVGTAFAADWPKGCSPAKPYRGVPKVNLKKTMGYMLLYPKADTPAEVYCDTLLIFLPREDVTLGDGWLRIMDGEDEVSRVCFSDTDRVTLHPIDEEELEAMMWGGGVCIEVKLPISLPVGGDWMALMGEGCFSAMDGKVLNKEVTAEDEWRVAVNDTYGVGRLAFTDAPEESAEIGFDAEVDLEEQLMKDEAPVTYKSEPEVGDIVSFDVAVGGDVKFASIYAANDSVDFPNNAIGEDTRVQGTLLDEHWGWTVMFLDENGETLDGISFGEVDETGTADVPEAGADGQPAEESDAQE